jgi:hypothetical protein
MTEQASCNWPVGYLARADIPCGKPALIRIDRPWRLPSFYICADHMNDPRVYREAQQNGVAWALLSDPDEQQMAIERAR